VQEGNTTLSVNLPSVALPQHEGMSRIVHVHINTPGVLAQVNSVLAEHHVNVEGQLLSTRGEYGYLITDISGGFTDEVLAQLRAMDQTVRLRVLS
jgi:D-3-phosphoglycerate dehydrogenase